MVTRSGGEHLDSSGSGQNPDTIRLIHAAKLQPQSGERLYRPFFEYYLENLFSTLQGIDIEAFKRAVDSIYSTQGKGQIFIAGNGGSATIAEHFYHNVNWDVSAQAPHGKKFSARCLNIENAEITARGNDRHHAYTFATMLDNHAREGDVFIGISASGNSDNIIKALKRAKVIGLTTIFIGKPKSSAEKIADVNIAVDSDDQQIIEDVSQNVIHMMIRALGVKLRDFSREDLLLDIAHLRNKATGIAVLSRELGEPVEIAARTRAEFATALDRFVDGKIARSTETAFSQHEDPYLIEPFGTDFTSFIRRVKVGDERYVAKFSFGVTRSRLIHEVSPRGIPGFAEVALMDSQAVPEEFFRTQYLHSIFPDNIPRPHKLVDNIAFYAFVSGKSLEQAILDGDMSPMARLGRLLRDWHDFFRINKPPEEIRRLCGGDLDRIRRYQTRYSTAEGLQTAFQPLFSNGYIDLKSGNEVLGLLADAASKLNSSGVLNLERDTWGHGDFKPENVVQSDQGELFLIDNDFHKKPAVVDVAKMISRSLALCFDRSHDPSKIVGQLSEFIAGYSADWDIPPHLSEIIAIDMINILSGYSTISPDLLDRSTHLAQILLRRPKDVIYYINHLTTGKHPSLDSIAEYFQEPTILATLR